MTSNFKAAHVDWAHLMILRSDRVLREQLAESRRLIEESRRLLASADAWTDQTSPEDTSGQDPPHGALPGST